MAALMMLLSGGTVRYEPDFNVGNLEMACFWEIVVIPWSHS
ncbi:hypothetical protein HAZT_HAZT008256 [Hyalella azteca]|uniref:Uncharacterized protein n=1 Tax=Hyalella azteca TaxID=294128 RepID=A0A6A0H488_HYAAZ|nr:hypothetical protein HAZT_HAZT008256 [Hyalella azteca]